jgi:uncharacterized protein (DUF362 family)
LPESVRISRIQEGMLKVLKQAINDSDLAKKQRIFVKPNLSHPEYLPGVVTNPALMFELVSLLRNTAEEVVVGESNGFNYPCNLAFEKTGMATAVKKAGGTVVNLSEDKVVKVKFKSDTNLKQLYLPKTVLDVDAIVDVALMKTHEFMKFSGAIKNLFGCLPDNRRIFLHPYLSEVFYRLYSILRPDLTVMDATVAMEGNGPTKGNPINMNLLFTSNNALAADIAATRIMGLDWNQINYLAYIADKTNFSEKDMKIQGLKIGEVSRKFEPPRIDLAVQAQITIYRSPILTKIFFSSLDVVKIFQKITVAYRKRK